MTLTGRRMEKLVTSLLSAGRDDTETALISSVLCKLPRLATLSDCPDSTCIINTQTEPHPLLVLTRHNRFI